MEEPGLDVLCVGEALVDFLPEQMGRRVAEVEKWTRCSGGSPANVAVGVARLGGRSALVGCVGRDEFGHFLRASLEAEGVDVRNLRPTDEGKTGLAFVSLTAEGERSFSFHRTRTAELFLGPQDVDAALISRSRAIHLGTNSLLWPDAQSAAAEMVRIAAARGLIICCDPNLRLHAWPDTSQLRTLVEKLIRSSTVAKLSEDEIEFVTGARDVEVALEEIHRMGALLPVVTLAGRGAAFLWKDCVVRVPAPVAKVVDTTGAGDGFTAGLLYGLTRRYANAAELQPATIGELQEIAGFGCAVGSRVVEKMGAVAGLPRRAEIEPDFPTIFRSG